jgi:uncharacterized membrane protein
MILLDIPTFLGRMHPLLVHLPIGFLMLAALFDWISYWPRYQKVRSAVELSVLLGAVSAVVAALLGWLLSTTGDYAPALLDQHMYSGLALAVVATLLYVMSAGYLDKYFTLPRFGLSMAFVIMMGLMTYTGHQGGNLTHGTEYLTLATLTETERIKPETLESVFVFEDVIQPLLEKRCGQCHQDGKLKGELRIKTHADLLKGGKSGPAIVAGDPRGSELYKRITLDSSHEEFMPTDGKTPLTSNEVELLRWWIEKAAAAENVKLVDIKGYEEITPRMAGMLGFGLPGEVAIGNSVAQINPKIPLESDINQIEVARKKGFIVRVMSHKPMMLDVTLPKPSAQNALSLAVLKPFAKNIIWLNLSGLQLTDQDVGILSECSNLEKLRMERNPIGNGSLKTLARLDHLQALNVYGTQVTAAGLSALKDMKRLEKIYMWKTAIQPDEVQKIFGDSAKIEVSF